MSFKNFKSILDHALNLGVGVLAITGGEPLLWKPLIPALQLCTKNGIVTQLSSNGSLITKEVIDKLSDSGLDILSISIDGVEGLDYSEKTLAAQPKLISLIRYAQLKRNIVVSANMVLTKNNCSQLSKVIEEMYVHRIPLSITLIDKPPDPNHQTWLGCDIDVDRMSIDELNHYLNFIVTKQKQGYNILHPKDYYLDFIRFKNGEVNWDCNLAKNQVIQIAPNGYVYWCLKLNQLSPYLFTDMSLNDFFRFRKENKVIIDSCNKRCYSGCAWFSYYYQRHPLEFLNKIGLPIISKKI